MPWGYFLNLRKTTGAKMGDTGDRHQKMTQAS
jgi:hypothetical protein